MSSCLFNVMGVERSFSFFKCSRGGFDLFNVVGWG